MAEDSSTREADHSPPEEDPDRIVPTDDETRDVLPVKRRVLNIFGGLGVLTFLGAMLTPVKDLAIAATGGEIELPGQQLVLAESYSPPDGSSTFEEGEVVTADLLGEPPQSVLVYPEALVGTNDYLIRLQRLEEDRIEEPTRLDWVDQGFVAYSAICTHLGCTVGWENSDDEPGNIPAEQREGASALCPCHISSFDVYRGATVMGGPASRPVPQIGVTVTEEGAIELTSEFEDDIGGE